MRTTHLAFGFLSLALLSPACSDSGANPASDFIACGLGELHVEGYIDGATVSLTQSTEGSGFGQSQEGGSFWMSQPIPAPTRLDLTIDWSPSIIDGATADVTSASLAMPAQPVTVAFAGQTFCAGAGSRIRIPKHSENVADLQFNLTSLTGDAGCTEAHTGMLRGCWRPDWSSTN
jgi:hypothetical protein